MGDQCPDHEESCWSDNHVLFLDPVTGSLGVFKSSIFTWLYIYTFCTFLYRVVVTIKRNRKNLRCFDTTKNLMEFLKYWTCCVLLSTAGTGRLQSNKMKKLQRSPPPPQAESLTVLVYVRDKVSHKAPAPTPEFYFDSIFYQLTLSLGSRNITPSLHLYIPSSESVFLLFLVFGLLHHSLWGFLVISSGS